MAKILIIGGVAGGASAATRLRRLDEKAEIIMFEKGEYVSFANCGLPYYIGGVIQKREKLIVQTPQAISAKYRIDVRNNQEVLKISPETKTVEVKNHNTQQIYKETYDKLILSPGADPVIPPLPGIESQQIFTLRTIPDTDNIFNFIEKHSPKKALVVGGGYIGLEMAESLRERGISVTVVEMLNQVMALFDKEMAEIFHEHIRSEGVELILNNAVKAFHENNNKLNVELADGSTLNNFDFVILAIGVRPQSELAKDAGLEIGKTGGIKVNKQMQTSNPDIYAIGDAVESFDFIHKNPVLVPLAGPASKQGRIVANNICGIPSLYKGTHNTAAIKVFHLTGAITGANEPILNKLGIDYEKIYLHPLSHASYYPGAERMSFKLLYEKPSGKVLGAQIIGRDGIDKRIDVIATAIRGEMTVFDLEELELAYAPPYSSANDPINIAGFIASNALRDDVNVISAEKIDSEKQTILDVRNEPERKKGAIPHSKNIPLTELRDRVEELPKDKPIVVHCASGHRSYVACRILLQHNFTVHNLTGGYKTYKHYFPSE